MLFHERDIVDHIPVSYSHSVEEKTAQKLASQQMELESESSEGRLIPNVGPLSQVLNASRVTAGQRFSCSEHFVNPLDWMQLPKSQGPNPLACGAI